MREKIIKKFEKIYKALADELSKDIFLERVLYSFTDDYQHIMNIICMTEEGKEVYNQLKKSTNKKVVFGSGIWGKNIVTAYKTIKFEAFVDNNVCKKDYFGLPVISFQDYMKSYRGADVIISSRLYHQEMYRQLIENGVPAENIINAGQLIDNMSKRQYFDLPALLEKRVSNEVFVDGGCFDGRTSVAFTQWCKDEYKKIYAFEPDPNNQIKCEKMLSERCENKYKIIPSGLWSKDAELRFNAIANGSSKVSDSGSTKIQVVPMDDNVLDEVTFIKLDVEGSEYEALLGAQKIIKKYKPKLAISIYHNPEDIWELPELLLSLNEEYCFYLRHYSVAASETVLYAL